MPTREEAKAIVLQTLTELKAFLNQPSSPRLSEADTKAHFIDPLLAALGYAGFEDITREYYVKSSQEYIDYVLKLERHPTVAIEAKALQVDLTDKFSAQLVQYCTIEGIEWCILTNARDVLIYNTHLRGGLDTKFINSISLPSFDDDISFTSIFDQMWLFSKESIANPARLRLWME